LAKAAAILDRPEIATLLTLVEEAARSTDEGVKRFVEPGAAPLIFVLQL
jgi:hypothetical protein